MTLYIDTKPQLDDWKEGVSHYNYVTCDTIFGRYKIEWKGWKDYPDYSIYLDQEYITDEAVGLDQAKAAAQADYEARTAERFRAIELPIKYPKSLSMNFESGWNACLEYILRTIAKATTPESLHTKL